MKEAADLPILTVAFATAEVRISHEPSTSLGKPTSDLVVLREDVEAPDTLTRIAVSMRDGSSVTVYVHWRPIITVNNLGISFDDPSSTLFLGAGTIAAAVNVRTRQVIDEHSVVLFWGFQRIGEYVLELGELDCFLRASTGSVLAETSVDPPYDIRETSEGVEFSSGVAGTTWLRFPRHESGA